MEWQVGIHGVNGMVERMTPSAQHAILLTIQAYADAVETPLQARVGRWRSFYRGLSTRGFRFARA